MSVGGFPRSVVVYGTGLMGCSLALALRKQFPTFMFTASIPGDSCRARAGGRHRGGNRDQPADLIVLATPVGAILAWLDEFPVSPGLIWTSGARKLRSARRAEGRRLAVHRRAPDDGVGAIRSRSGICGPF